MLKWKQYTTLLSESKSSHSCATHTKVRGALSLHRSTHSCDHLNVLRFRFIPLHLLPFTENANKHVPPLLQYAAPQHCMPHHLPSFTAQCEYLFAQTGLLSNHLLLQNSPHTCSEVAVKSEFELCTHQLGAAGDVYCLETGCS